MSDNIHILELSQYTQPKIVEKSHSDYIEYGVNNDYYDWLIDRYKNSPTNNAVINNMARLIYGKGLEATNASQKPNEYAQFKSLFSKDTIRAVVLDLKLFGNCAFQVIYSKDRMVTKVEHLPINLLRPEKCDDKGNINAYYYCNNWDDVRKYGTTRIPVLGSSRENIEVLVLGHYSVGQKYFSSVDYEGCLDYCVLEEEIATYLINLTQNGFAPRLIVNFNNGKGTEEQQRKLVKDVERKLTGSTGLQYIVSFNDSETTRTTIDQIPLDDAPEHYKYVSEEAERKILAGHNVTSSMLVGIGKENQGFNNNGEELKVAAGYFYNKVILPFQELIIDGVDKILAINGISLNLYFERLVLIDEPKQQTVNMSSESEINDDVADGFLEELEGESIDDEWEVVGRREYKEDNSSIDEWIAELEPKKSLLTKLADFISSFPSKWSTLDKSVYKVRYEYLARYKKDKTRKFCQEMMRRTENGVVYRLEDIDKASRNGVNKSLGHQGQPYDLFKFKGGVNCGHYWGEVLYKLKQKDGKYVEDKALSSSSEVASIPKTYKPRPRGTAESKIAPIDMPNNGHHPNYRK